MNPLSGALEAWLPEAVDRIRAIRPEPRIEHVGRVARVGDGIATITGLPNVRAEEMLSFASGVLGMALMLDAESTGCILFGDSSRIGAGDTVHGTGAVVRVPVGEALLGRVLDSVGRPLDDEPPPEAERLDPVEREAPAVIDRDLVSEPLLTGLLVIDSMFTIGRGQRELIIGDRATGKTAIAVDAVINQRHSDVICIYVAIGQKSSDTRQVIEAVRTHGAPERCIFVVAAADSAPGLQWLAPFAGMTMAEYFRDRGRDVLVVIDDLSKHAAVHRELALLLREPPGREAYPGDIFYLHARLLERAAKLGQGRGGGSITALPIAETQAGNLSAYIPTNLISITDGQIVLDAKLFYEGQKPAVDVGRSVSRIGGKAQPASLREVSASLRLDYAQFLEIEVFTRFGAMVDERTRKAIEHGRHIRAALQQTRYAPLPLAVEVVLLLALSRGALDTVPLAAMTDLQAGLRTALEPRLRPVFDRLDAGAALTEADRAALLQAMQELAAKIAAGAAPP
ncbi:MAG TPA: F0F1 ATP synthase subunit alpha [Stellaceae bacterium]|nr:F0F1 ATP synthase subunit alpha [Stellaceae bacterium]